MRRVLVPLLTLLSLVATACPQTTQETETAPEPRQGTFPVTIDSAGGAVTIEERPERIVSLSPTATEILFAIGAGDQVIAVDDQSNFPPEAPTTDLSGFQPNVEAIADHQPDLVIYSFDPGDLGDSLAALGTAALLQPGAMTLDDTYDQIQQLGAATGNVGKAEELVNDIKQEIKRAAESAPTFEEPPTYYHELDNTLFSAASGTFIGQIYGLLGLQNIADEADAEGTGYPQLSAEYIIDADPDFIFLANTKCCGESAESVAARPGWNELTAVKEGRVIELDDDIASRWGPRVVDFLRTIAAALQDLEI